MVGANYYHSPTADDYETLGFHYPSNSNYVDTYFVHNHRRPAHTDDTSTGWVCQAVEDGKLVGSWKSSFTVGDYLARDKVASQTLWRTGAIDHAAAMCIFDTGHAVATPAQVYGVQVTGVTQGVIVSTYTVDSSNMAAVPHDTSLVHANI